MISYRVHNGRKTWIATTPKGEREEFTVRKDAVEWLMHHSCDTFVPHPSWYADFCGTCGGHVSMHEQEQDQPQI